MNKKRRAQLKEAIMYINLANRIVDRSCDEEQDCLDNMPENLEGSYRYEKMEEAVDSLNDALNGIEAVLENIKDAMA